MFCPKCGVKVKEAASFCSGCGGKIPSIIKADKPEVKEKVAAAPAATPQLANRVILFVLVGLILFGLSIASFFYWQKTKESREDETLISEKSTVSQEKAAIQSEQPSQSTTNVLVTEPLINESLTKLVLTQGDVSKLKLDQELNNLDEIKKSDPQVVNGLDESYVVTFDDDNKNSNLANLALKYTSLETAKAGYQYIKNNLYRLLYEWEDTAGQTPEALTSQKFGSESEIKKLKITNGDYETLITCIFRLGNIIEILGPLDQPLTEADIYQYAKILEDKINKTANNSSAIINASPTSSPELSTKERIDNAYDSVVKSNLRLLQIGLDQYYINKSKYPATLQSLLEENIVTKIPVDPRTKEPYFYQSDGKGFTLMGKLGNGSEYKISQ